MALIEVLSPDLKSRLEIARILQGLGHQPVHAADLKDFADLQTQAPDVMVAVEPATDWVAEIRRAAPSLPLVVCLSDRSAARALEYLRLGVADCVAPPVTREALGACVRKALRLSGTVLELADLPAEKPRRKKRSAALPVSVFVLLAALGLGLKRWVTQPPDLQRAWDLPYLHPAGLAAYGESYWVSDWYSQSVYEHDQATLAVRRVRSFPSEPPAALAVAEGSLWIGTSDGRVTKHLLDTKLTLLAQFKIPAATLSGLCYDGLYLWSADRRQKKLRQHLLDDKLTVAREYDYPKGAPAAIAGSPRGFWSVEEDGQDLLLHNLKDPGEIIGRRSLDGYGPGRWKAAGLSLAEGRLVSVAESADGTRAMLVLHRP